MKHVFHSLKNYNFRLFFYGQIISLTGSWMQQVASVWLAYRLTHSAMWLGIISFFSQIPVLICGPLAGVFIDRLSRRKILMATQIISLIQAFVLAYLTLTGKTEIYSLLVLSIILGIINSFDIPARQAFVTEIVQKDTLHNAIALNSTAVNFSRMAGPALAGILAAQLGEGICFIFNGISFLAGLLSILLMKNLIPFEKKPGQNFVREITDGVGYLWGQKNLRILIISLAMVSFATMAQVVVMPVFAKKVLLGGAETLGLLMASSGLGAFVGSFLLAGRKSSAGLTKLINRSVLIISLCFFLFGLTKNLWLGCGLLFIAGFGALVLMAGTNTLFQLNTPPHFRGRMMSLYTMTFIGLAPFGGLVGGLITSKFGANITFIIFSLLIATTGFWAIRQTQKISANF